MFFTCTYYIFNSMSEVLTDYGSVLLQLFSSREGLHPLRAPAVLSTRSSSPKPWQTIPSATGSKLHQPTVPSVSRWWKWLSWRWFWIVLHFISEVLTGPIETSQLRVFSCRGKLLTSEDCADPLNWILARVLQNVFFSAVKTNIDSIGFWKISAIMKKRLTGQNHNTLMQNTQMWKKIC